MATTITPWNENPSYNKVVEIDTEATSVTFSFTGLPELQEKLLLVRLNTAATISFPAETEWVGSAPTWAENDERLIRIIRTSATTVLAENYWTAT